MKNAFPHLDARYAQLKQILSRAQKILVAFSGGVDSTFLLKTIVDQAPSLQVLAVTAVSATTSQQEHADALAFARRLGVEHQVIQSQELELPEFFSNPPEKCYICKKHRFGHLVNLAREHNCDWVVDGENVDDQQDFRPGHKAAQELGVRSPLREAGLTKADIRMLSRREGLPSWNKPSMACLASRIPYHQPISAEKLQQVDQAETFLRDLGFLPQLRVRHYGDTARLEPDAKDIPTLLDPHRRNHVVQHLKSLGFTYVTLDLEGYRMGSLNQGVRGQLNDHL